MHSKLIEKQKYSGDWPFKDDRVVVQREGNAITVLLGGATYALNGYAVDAMDLTHVHEAKRTVLVDQKHGVRGDIGPFIRIGNELGK